MPFNPTHPAVASLYQRLGPFNGPGPLENAVLILTAALRHSMAATNLYSLPVEQALPEGADPDSIAVMVHPYNIASALIGVTRALQEHFSAQTGVDPSLQVYQVDAPAGWQQVLALAPTFPVVAVQVEKPAPAAIPPAPPPVAAAIPPAAPAPAAPVATPALDVAALVDAALGTATITPQIDAATLAAPVAQPANPVQPVVAEAITTPEQYEAYRQAQAAAAAQPAVIDHATQQSVSDPLAALAQAAGVAPAPAPQTAQGVAGPAVVSHAQAQAEAAHAVVTAADGLPDSSVLAERTTKTGRPQKSPFEKPVEKRNKIAAAPWWWALWHYTAPRLFTANPAAAMDPEPTGAAPVQAYAAFVELQLAVLDHADGKLTVAELRAWLREVQSGINQLPSAEAINQLADKLFREIE